MGLLKKKACSPGSKEKEKEALADAASEHSSPPPSYTAQAEDCAVDDLAGPPDITAGFANLSLTAFSGTNFPKLEECIAHLKLLECFYALRQRIGSTDGLFGISDSLVTNLNKGEPPKDAAIMAKLAEKRWAVYLTRAVDRFKVWSMAVTVGNTYLTCKSTGAVESSKYVMAKLNALNPSRHIVKNLPPIDVLMVWHAYMLNLRSYLEDCLRQGRLALWATPMPWHAIDRCINNSTFGYEPGHLVRELFEFSTRLPWDNLADRNEKRMHCSKCGGDISVPWTTCYEHIPSETKSLNSTIEETLSSGTGYTDPEFNTICPHCRNTIDHERLRAVKFNQDVQRLLKHDVPMPGTVLDITGLPACGLDVVVTTLQPATFPNRLLHAIAGDRSGLSSANSISAVRDEIEFALRDRKIMKQARGTRFSALPSEKIGIRRMMSRYWNNSSPFALDLVGAVVRQGSFVEKMHNVDWLHSPALPATMTRLLVKYSRFFEIMQDRSHMAVPTLDVDLAWHTHQLNPSSYLQYSFKQTGTLIDHDDKVAETRLNDAFVWTSKTYQKKFGEAYSECTCWYCEAVRESHTSAASRLFNTQSAIITDSVQHCTPDTSSDPKKSVHISAHNAVRPTDSKGLCDARARAAAAQLERHYQKACARARRKGRREPRRDDYYYSDAWGYPVYMPMYAPYVGAYYGAGASSGMYVSNPACMALGAGAVGNCCTGTCVGGVAAGGCAAGTMVGGLVSGGCAGGGMAGGCGGGGGGGFGGGCGGGGGGIG
ncbi:hypothetical protein LTR50_004618 [Elasticomyces elasticus]|nr:hypothetical protein LTR50_004618 [Elasticomyces elasticus]